MALIGQIRKNSWILVVMIALGLGGFILMDMTSGQQSVFGSGQFSMGSVNGEKLDWNEFNRTEQLLYGGSASGDVYSRRDYLWNYYVEEAIVQKESDELGLGVGRDELMDLQFGSSPSPIIRARFPATDPNLRMTGAVNRQVLNNIKTIIEQRRVQDAISKGELRPDFTYYWAHQENEIIKERLQGKINGMVSKGMYTPTWMAEMGANEQSQRVDFAYVKIPYDELANSEVVLEDADYQAYLSENENKYKADEETRVVEYTTFEVLPSSEDTAQWQKRIADLVPEFEASTDDSTFVERNYGTISGTFFKKSAVGNIIADSVFSMPIGSVMGPYQEGNAFKAVKVLDRKVIPDSVRSRHILISANTPLDLINAQKTIDSLKNLIETGVQPFDTLAAKFGSDGTALKGGDLGYAFPGQMVPEFNNLIFYQAEENKLYSVVTQFGVHLVEVTGKKFLTNEESVQLAYLTQPIVPSEETQNNIYERVLRFVGDNRSYDAFQQSVASDPALNLNTASGLLKNGYSIQELDQGNPQQSSRDLIRWAFTARAKDVSPEIYSYQDQVELYDNKYVVACLRNIQKPGAATLDAVRSDIEPIVTNLKKGEKISSEIAGKSLMEVAATYSTNVDTVKSISFNQGIIPGLGSEPKVMAVAFNTPANQVSKPIIGESGVYLISVVSPPGETDAAGNIPSVRQQMSSSARIKVAGLIQAIKKNAEIKDNRSKFY